MPACLHTQSVPLGRLRKLSLRGNELESLPRGGAWLGGERGAYCRCALVVLSAAPGWQHFLLCLFQVLRALPRGFCLPDPCAVPSNACGGTLACVCQLAATESGGAAQAALPKLHLKKVQDHAIEGSPLLSRYGKAGPTRYGMPACLPAPARLPCPPQA